jgi:hypothetical protein
MKTFAEYLEEFRKEIEKGYHATKMVSALCGHVYEDREKVPTGFLMYDGPPTASNYAGDISLITLNAKLRNVKTFNAGLVVDMKDWADDPEQTAIETIMGQFGKDVSDNEYWVIANAMITYAGYEVAAKKKEELSKQDIIDAQNNVLGTYADCVIMSPLQKAKFLNEGQMLDPWSIPRGFIPEERRGYYYSGMLGGVNVYVASFAKNYALVFSRDEMIFQSEPLKVSFDNINHPKQLILRKMCASAPMYDNAVAKIQIN